MQEKTKQSLIRLMEQIKSMGTGGNSLLIKKDGKELFRHTTGNVNDDTVFRIFSMTKVCTAVAVLQLVEAGRITLDDPVYLFIPEYKDLKVYDENEKELRPVKNALTVRHLLTMTSGYPYPNDTTETGRKLISVMDELAKKYPENGYTAETFAVALASVPVMFEPGESWCYGFGHDILGGIIERITGERFSVYLEENIFSPLGMKNTAFRMEESEKSRLAPFSHPDFSDDDYFSSSEFDGGGGGLLSTADDYMTFAETLARGGTAENGYRLLGRKTIDLMRSDALKENCKKTFDWDFLKGYSYGLGVRTYINPIEGGVAGSVGEFGWCGAAGTWVLIDPNEKLSVVYMHQRMPNLEGFLQPRFRAIIYSDLD